MKTMLPMHLCDMGNKQSTPPKPKELPANLAPGVHVLTEEVIGWKHLRNCQLKLVHISGVDWFKAEAKPPDYMHCITRVRIPPGAVVVKTDDVYDSDALRTNMVIVDAIIDQNGDQLAWGSGPIFGLPYVHGAHITEPNLGRNTKTTNEPGLHFYRTRDPATRAVWGY